MTKKLKRVVLKEELVVLTGDATEAMVLSQMLYWAEIVQEMDNDLKKRIESYKKLEAADQVEKMEKQLRYGWFFKSAQELADELMGIASQKTIKRRLDSLVEKTYLLSGVEHDKKHSNKFRKDTYYKVNFRKIQMDLEAKGYPLEGYALLSASQNDEVEETPKLPNGQNDQSQETLISSIGQNDQSRSQFDQSSGHHDQSNTEITNKALLTEIIFDDAAPLSDQQKHHLNFIYKKMIELGFEHHISNNTILAYAKKYNFDRPISDDIMQKAFNRFEQEKKINSVENFFAWCIDFAYTLNKSSYKVKVPKNKAPKRTEVIPEWFENQQKGLTPIEPKMENFEAQKAELEKELQVYKQKKL